MADRYYKGRPRKHRRKQLASLWITGIAAMIYLGSALGCLSLNIRWLVEQPGWWPMLLTLAAGSITLVFTWLFGISLRNTIRDRGRILPYFPKPTDGTLGGAWLSGEALSANCAVLDQLAIDAGVRSLSSFGFGDDLDGEIVEWNEPEEGLRTLEALMRWLDLDRDEPQSNSHTIRRELTTLHAVLLQAQTTRTPFALVVRLAKDSTSQGEMNQRKGSYS